MKKVKTIKSLEELLSEDSPVSFKGVEVSARKSHIGWRGWRFEKGDSVVSLIRQYDNIRHKERYEALQMGTGKEVGTFNAFRTAVRKTVSFLSQ